jgi:hypothetical protein
MRGVVCPGHVRPIGPAFWRVPRSEGWMRLLRIVLVVVLLAVGLGAVGLVVTRGSPGAGQSTQ